MFQIGFRTHPRHLSVEVQIESFYIGGVLLFAPDQPEETVV